MIELVAQGPVETSTDEKVRKKSGHDDIYGRVTTTTRETVEIDLEFPQGYVNLEGYAPSSHHCVDPLGSVSAYVPDGSEPIADEWDVALYGEWFDWVQQAHRYVTERPDESIVSCLETFKNWDETDSDTIGRAIDVATFETELATRLTGDLDAPELELLRAELNDLENVQIPESYS